MTDAIVIGGGVMGLAAARDLRRRGYAVTLLERAQPGRAASWASAGIIGATLRDESDPSYHLRRLSRELWPAFAEAVQGESGVDPEYREMGCVQLASDAAELAALHLAAQRQRDGATANEPPTGAPRPDVLDAKLPPTGAPRPDVLDTKLPPTGASRPELLDAKLPPTGAPRPELLDAKLPPTGASRPDVLDAKLPPTGAPRPELLDANLRPTGERPELLDAKQLRELEPALSPSLAGGLLVSGGNVDNRRLCKALEIAARRAGVLIETGVEVTAIETAGGRVNGVEISRTSALTRPRAAAGHDTSPYRRTADLVVLAAGAWSATIDNLSPTPPVAPQRGQILALDQSSVGISHVLLTPGDPYFVPRCDGRLVIGATREEAGWDPSLTAAGVAWLLNRAMQVVPALQNCPIAEMWTGFRPASADGLPLIGKGAPDGLYFLTGHGPSGIAPLPGSIALLMALIHGEPPPLPAAAFDPLRFERAAVDLRA